jgi:hypothetical protein
MIGPQSPSIVAPPVESNEPVHVADGAQFHVLVTAFAGSEEVSTRPAAMAIAKAALVFLLRSPTYVPVHRS